MNLIAFAYTAGGGIVGAAATQYVTHVRDRRAARALVIEQITKVETAYAALRISFDAEAMEVNPLPRLDELLGSLEAAALIAGVPRVFLRPYIDCVRLCYECRRLEAAADSLAFKLVKNLPMILEADKSLEPAKAGEYAREAIELLKDMRNAAFLSEDHDGLPQWALSLLSAAIWHPYIAQIARRKASRLMRALDKLDKGRQQLILLNRKLEGKPDLTSYIARQLSAMDEARPKPSMQTVNSAINDGLFAQLNDANRDRLTSS